MSLWAELKRRNVIRVGIAYVLMGWLLLQGADFVFDLIGAPNWVIQSLTVIVAIGLPIALFFAWAFELTPEGIKRDEDVDRSQSIAPRTGRTLDRLIIAFLALVVAIMGVERFYFTGSGSNAPSSTSAETAGTTSTTIAVLPFVNMSSDTEQEYFSDGITEEILNRLAQVESLQVTARTSTFSFKGQNLDVREIAETLGVDNILEGSVRRDGELVRITAQLVRASDGFHLWSEAYDRRLESIFAVQDEISGEIARALQVSLGIAEAPGAAREVNPEAYDLYLRARALHRKRGPGVVTAIELFEQSLAIDPDFAPAWAGLSHALNVVKVYISREEGDALGDTIQQSIEAATRALELDPDLPTGLHAMGQALMAQFHLLEAEAYFERAVAADPDSTALMEDYNHFLVYTWRPEAAENITRRMLELDPLVAVFHFSAKTTFHSLGDLAARNQAIDTGLALNPDMVNLQLSKIKALVEARELDAAHAFVDTMDLQDWTSAQGLHRLIDWTTTPQAPLDEELVLALRYVPEMAIYARRYDLWIEHAFADRGTTNWETKLMYLSWLNTPIGGSLYTDLLDYPEVHALMEEVGLVDYWRARGWPKRCQPVGEDAFACN